MKQLGTREDQDNNDVVVGAGHEAHMGTWQQRGQSHDKIRSIALAIKQARKRRFWALFIILTLKCCRVTLLDNYQASKLILYSLGDLLPEGSAWLLTFGILPTNSHLSSFYVCQLISTCMLAVCSFSSLSISCSIKSLCNILYKTSYLHPFILTLTLSEAQEALRLLAFSQNLGRSFSHHVIRRNSLFSIYQQLFPYHSITSVCLAFDQCLLIRSELVLALLSIIRHHFSVGQLHS